MYHFNLFFLFGLVAIANGHLSIDRSNRYQRERVTASLKDNDLNHHRSLNIFKEFQLQLAWWNWNFCTNAYYNKSFTPTNSLVPSNTIFLAGYPTFKLDNSSDTCKSETIVRTGTISTGQQTVFFPIYNYLSAYDVADDWETGTCGITFPNETDAVRLSLGESDNARLSNATLKEQIYSTIDGKNINPVYLYDTANYILDACEDNRNQTEYFQLQSPGYLGDTCDFDPIETIGGSDIGPMTGYYGIDTRTWADGESHTYEFGSISECITAKYVLTAKSPCTVSWDIYNSKTDKFVATIVGNGTTIKNPPPCGRINIEALVPSSCASKNITRVTIELYRNDSNNNMLIRQDISYSGTRRI